MNSPQIAANEQSSFGMHHLAKKAVFAQLKKLHTGILVVVDGGVRHVFGDLNESSGSQLSAELHVVDRSCFFDIMTGGSIGAAESFMTGDWTTPDLAVLIRVMVRNMDILDHMEGGVAKLSKPVLKAMHHFNQNTPKGSRRNIAAHYDLGNDFFQEFLDPTMMYSSGIFQSESSTLEEASTYKLDTICRTLQLKESDHVVEIGTGWGGFAIHAAKHYGCHVTTTTISEQQFVLAKERVKREGLEDKVTLLLKDYRELRGEYDKLVSIEMIEAVGWKYYDIFYETCSRLLKPDGLMLIQAITIADQRYEQAKKDVDFIQRYIFPGSCIPSLQALMTASMNSSDLRLVQQQDFAQHYARTLRAWNDACKAKAERISALGYSETFQRMWEFYLAYCEGGFAERVIGVSHILYAKPLFRDEYVV
jgi:cyclopropane-fatty-acyl-phospholipid synthase